MSGNLRIYDAGKAVPKEACKDFNKAGFRGTMINPIWRIRTMTEIFGPLGIGWRYDTDFEAFGPISGSERVVLFAKCTLHIKDGDKWSAPIIGHGGTDLVRADSRGAAINDEAYKMAATDALGNACSKLGIGADVYWERGKYDADEKELPKEPAKDDPFFKRTKPETEQPEDPKEGLLAMIKSGGAARIARHKEALGITGTVMELPADQMRQVYDAAKWPAEDEINRILTEATADPAKAKIIEDCRTAIKAAVPTLQLSIEHKHQILDRLEEAAA